MRHHVWVTQTQRPGDETRILRTVSTVMFVLGVGAAVLFLRDPDVREQPQLAMFGVTALIGAGVLRVVARLIGEPAGPD